MTRSVVVDNAAAEEAETQVRYYAERAGEGVALRFVAEIEAIYRGLAEGRFVGVNHPHVRFRLPDASDIAARDRARPARHRGRFAPRSSG
jgi:plasmid stabilization system protein ParE